MTELTPTALLVEDEPQIRRFVRTALEAEGWQVFEAETLQRGLTDAGTRKPDLVILDLGLLMVMVWILLLMCAVGHQCPSLCFLRAPTKPIKFACWMSVPTIT